MTFRTLLGLGLLVAGVAGAADAGDDTPDASAGNGGSQMMTQEGDETGPNGTCSLSRDCERGFACVSGRCRYQGYRQAEQGCQTVPSLAALLAIAAVTRRRSGVRAADRRANRHGDVPSQKT